VLHLPPLPEDASVEHFQAHLTEFIEGLGGNELPTIRRELSLDGSHSLE
jgi:hypothetical protein